MDVARCYAVKLPELQYFPPRFIELDLLSDLVAGFGVEVAHVAFIAEYAERGHAEACFYRSLSQRLVVGNRADVSADAGLRIAIAIEMR